MKKFICMTGILLMCVLAPFGILNAQTLSQESLFSKSGFWPIDTAMDPAHNHYAVGSFWGTVRFGEDTLTSDGAPDIFIVKYGPDGKLLWAVKEGGKKNDGGFGLWVDTLGNVYVTGYFSDTATFSQFELVSAGAEDFFLAKYDKRGNLIWATRAGGEGKDVGLGIIFNEHGNLRVMEYISGKVIFKGKEIQKKTDGTVVATYGIDGTLLSIE